MPKAIHTGSTLCLNSSNDPSIPASGLELTADTAIPITAAQAVYLRTLPNVTVTDDPVTTSSRVSAQALKLAPIRPIPRPLPLPLLASTTRMGFIRAGVAPGRVMES